MTPAEPHYGVSRPLVGAPLTDDWQHSVRRPLHLTFDDGPDPDWTPRVLDTLARYEATATFFVLGWRMREHPELIDDILLAGHDVELHGDAHLDHEIATLGELVEDTQNALGLLRDHGVIPQWWRIPFGRPGPHTAKLAEAHGVRIVGWDVDTHDWRGDRWLQQPAQVSDAAERGGVVLLHDAVAPGTPRTGADNTLELVSALLQHAGRHQVVALGLPPAQLAGPDIPTEPGPSPFGRSQAAMRSARAKDAGRQGLAPGDTEVQRPGKPAA